MLATSSPGVYGKDLLGSSAAARFAAPVESVRLINVAFKTVVFMFGSQARAAVSAA